MPVMLYTYIRKASERIAWYFSYYFKLCCREPHVVQHNKWRRIKGDETLRLNYPLTPSSIVFDLGGYKGQWTAGIYGKYGCSVYVFEPVRQYYLNLVKLFNANQLIKVHNFGLLDESGAKCISLGEDGSSLYGSSSDKELIFVKDVEEFVRENDIRKIDLMKINIEGAEYKLLNRMITCRIVEMVSDIQVQFHRCIENYERARFAIRMELCKTHVLTYDFPFLWENWRRKSS